jgi:hypothetical protein
MACAKTHSPRHHDPEGVKDVDISWVQYVCAKHACKKCERIRRSAASDHTCVRNNMPSVVSRQDLGCLAASRHGSVPNSRVHQKKSGANFDNAPGRLTVES